MKANLETVKEYLQSNEEVISTLYCAINLGYVSRSGILAATNKKLLFCADYMFRKGFKWEYEYAEVNHFNHTNVIVVEISSIPAIKKIILNYGDDFIVFDNFSTPSNVNPFYELVQSKI
ncbi:PH domain-containing protein [Bacillus cereus]|uniref:PH domain-containing protein n=1 Tax=Bacillus cereus TaxID=1396 RepID=UPI00366DF62C